MECPIDRTMIKIQRVGNYFHKTMDLLENSVI